MPMRFLGGPSRSEITNVLVKDSLLDDIYYQLITFQDTNGFSLVLTGSGAVTLIENIVKLATALTIGSTARLSFYLNLPSLASGLSIFSWNKRRTVRTSVLFSSNTEQTIYVTSGGINAAAEHFIGFKIVNGTLRGCVGNGTVETQVPPADGIAIASGTHYLLEARFIPGVECRFYVNLVERGVLTAHLPYGTSDSNRLIDCYIRSDSLAGANKEISFDFWEFYQAR